VARKSYIAALTEVLQPEGFSRDGQWWSRTVGTVLEQTDLQRSSVAGGGVTVNLWSKDLETEKILQGRVRKAGADHVGGEADQQPGPKLRRVRSVVAKRSGRSIGTGRPCASLRFALARRASVA